MFSKMLISLVLVVALWNTWSIHAAVVPTGPLRSYIIGGYQGIQTRNLKASSDCSQYADDLHVLYYLPFLVMINPMAHQWEKSTAQMDPTDTFVTHLVLRDFDSTIPESIFCLKRLVYLTIENMKFVNDVVPDSLGNLKRLSSLEIRNTRISSMTPQLTSLRLLNLLYIYQCSLTQLPNLSEMENLQYVSVQYNRLSQLNRLNNPYGIDLQYNNLTELPSLGSPDAVHYLYMQGNPLKHVMSISSFVNLNHLSFSNTPITFIPPNIDRLQNLQSLDLAYTKLTYLPRNILKLNKLRYLYIQGNNFEENERLSLIQEFNRTLPNCTLWF